jgi:hypothetical protein
VQKKPNLPGRPAAQARATLGPAGILPVGSLRQDKANSAEQTQLCKTKPIWRKEASGTGEQASRSRGQLCETKPNLGRMGCLENDEPLAQNEANPHISSNFGVFQ